MKLILTTIITVVMGVFMNATSVKDKTSCTFLENDTYYELIAEFPKAKREKVFEIVNKNTNGAFNLSINNETNEKKAIANGCIISIKSSNKKIKIKAEKKENPIKIKTKLTKMLEEIKTVIN